MVPSRSRDVLARLGLPPGVGPIAFALEVSIVVLLLTAPKYGAVLLGGYLLIVITLFGRALMSGAVIADCACSPRVRPVDYRFFLRNVALIGLSILVWQAAPDWSSWWSVVASGVAFFAAWTTEVFRLRVVSTAEQMDHKHG